MHNKILYNLSAALLFPVFFSCSPKEKEAHSEHETLDSNMIELSADQFKAAGITFGTVEQRNINSILRVNGYISVAPQDIASVSAQLGGFIKSTTLVQGSAVSKGQILAEIENMEFIDLQKEYLETRAKFKYAQVEYSRHSELYKENVYSEKNMQQTETEYKLTLAQLKALEQKLILLGIDPDKLREDNISSTFPLRSPISGYIKNINVSIGKYVAPTDAILEIVNPGNVLLEMNVFEKDVDRVTNGQYVTFTTPNEPSRKFKATIYQAGKALDDDKTTRVYARIDKPCEGLLSGMYVNADIEIRSNSVATVPQEAVVQFNDKFYIFSFKGIRAENGKNVNDFEAIEVVKGASSEGYTEIILPENLKAENLKVVVKGAYTLLSAWKNSGEMAC